MKVFKCIIVFSILLIMFGISTRVLATEENDMINATISVQNEEMTVENNVENLNEVSYGQVKYAKDINDGVADTTGAAYSVQRIISTVFKIIIIMCYLMVLFYLFEIMMLLGKKNTSGGLYTLLNIIFAIVPGSLYCFLGTIIIIAKCYAKDNNTKILLDVFLIIGALIGAFLLNYSGHPGGHNIQPME